MRRGLWNLWCNDVWLVFDLACLFFGFFSGWISCYIIFLRHHGLSGSETSWAYFGTSIKIQGPKWFHELWEFKSYWKLLKMDQWSNLIKSDMVLSDDGTQSKTTCTVLSGRYVRCVMKFMKWRKKTQSLEHDIFRHMLQGHEWRSVSSKLRVTHLVICQADHASFCIILHLPLMPVGPVIGLWCEGGYLC